MRCWLQGLIMEDPKPTDERDERELVIRDPAVIAELGN